MSFNELVITIAAENMASAEFNKVATDAAAMGSAVGASASGFETLKTQAEATTLSLRNMCSDVRASASEMTEGFKVAGSEAVLMGENVAVSVNGMAAEFAKAGVEVTAMGESVRATGSSFVELQTQVEATTVSLRTVASAFGSVASMGSAIISLAGDLGIVDRESAKWARTVMAVITLTSAWIRLKSYLTVLTTGHTAAIALNTAAQNANATSSLAVAAAHHIKAAATWIAVHAQNALNISHATFLALTGVGIGVIISAAAAMAYFASQMNAATASVQSFNEAAGEMPFVGRSVRRAGELELYRRGVE
jgi:hypothetical protein